MPEKKDYLTELKKLIKKYGLTTLDEPGSKYIRINLPNLTDPDDSFADLDRDDDELIYYKELSLSYDAETNTSHIKFGDGYNRTDCVSGLKEFETVVKKLIKVADVYNSMNKQLKSKVKEIGIAEDF